MFLYILNNYNSYHQVTVSLFVEHKAIHIYIKSQKTRKIKLVKSIIYQISLYISI